MNESAELLLINPKHDFNVGGALRACHIFGAQQVGWTGPRVGDKKSVRLGAGYRLPREERMKEYRDVVWGRNFAPDEYLRDASDLGRVPIAVELRDEAESLESFEHPSRAIYVFGPEDGSIPKAILALCHRFIRVPAVTRAPLNLAACTNVVLYDRFVKFVKANGEV